MDQAEKVWAGILLKLREQSTRGLSFANIRSQIQAAIREQNQGRYCDILDIYGDESSGDVVYSHGYEGGLFKCSYELQGEEGNRRTVLGEPVPVLPRTAYDEVQDDLDGYAQMERRMRFDERFIPRADREKAQASDFAGKNRSFPILEPADVMAAVRSMGRAGAENFAAGTLKANIIKLAKRKGWGKYLPKAWRGGDEDASESGAELEIVGDAVLLKEGAVGQDGTAYLKLIAPGRGSSGYYPADVLERDGPKIFKKGTKNYWNHQTAAEESARPEGDLRDVASVLTEDAQWESSGPAGAGLYARAQVMEHYRNPVDQLAPHIGMSIRAMGVKSEKPAPDGKPGLIEKLTRAVSVDYVTEPGAGGKVLQLFEAARNASRIPPVEGENDMDQAAVLALIESKVGEAVAPLKAQAATLQAENTKLKERAAIADAGRELDKIFAPLIAKQPCKDRVKGRLLAGRLPFKESGELDLAALKTLAEAELLEEVSFLSEVTGAGKVENLGPSTSTKPDAMKPEEFQKALQESLVAQGYSVKEAEIAARGRV